MLNEQIMGMLQNNAGNPEIVKRIAEENDLSQTEIAQALKIPEESAARYMPAMGERQIMNQVGQPSRREEPAPIVQEPSMGGVKPESMPQKPGNDLIALPAPYRPGMDDARLSDQQSTGGGFDPYRTVGMTTGNLSNPASISNAAPQLPTASPAAQAPSVSGQMVSAMQKPMAAPSEPVAAEKPGSLPSQMKPQTMMEGKPTMTSRRPGGNPSLPRVPAFERGRQNLENERAFVDAFNRLRARGDLL